MTTEKRDFDAAAASWDEKPGRVKLAGEVAEAIIRQVAPSKTMKAMDFGCGTGLVTLTLRPLVASITGIDSSPHPKWGQGKIKYDLLPNINLL